MERNFRFKGFPWYNKAQNITVTMGGAGGIGSYFATCLLRTGIGSLMVYDFDNVEQHNLGCQFYPNTALYLKKTKALEILKSQYSAGHTHLYTRGKFEIGSTVSSITCSCFDNLEARALMFEEWINFCTQRVENGYNIQEAIFIDGRLEGEMLQIYAIRPQDGENITKYRRTLDVNNLIVGEARCTTEQTTHIGMIIGGLMTSILLNHLTNVTEGLDVRDVPYFTELFTPVMNFKSL